MNKRFERSCKALLVMCKTHMRATYRNCCETVVVYCTAVLDRRQESDNRLIFHFSKKTRSIMFKQMCERVFVVKNGRSRDKRIPTGLAVRPVDREMEVTLQKISWTNAR